MAALIRGIALALLLATAAAAQEVSPAGIRTGESLPAIAGIDLNRNPVELTQFLGRGSVVLAFWSVHCVDCIRELDDLRSIRREFPPEEVTVVAVNTDSGLPVERIAGFLRRYEAARGGLEVEHILDRDATILTALGIRFIPVLAVLDRTGRVTSVLTGYQPEDRARVAQAMEEGRIALGAWSEGLRGRVRTLLRGTAPTGGSLEWGSFRVEQGMPLFGLYGASGWLADPAGRRDRQQEASRVEAVVGDRLRVALLAEALASLGVRLPAPSVQPFGRGGVEVPVSPFEADTRWKRLYDALRFDELYRTEARAGSWVGDEFWAGLVGDVDLGRLRERVRALNFPAEPARIRLETVSDFDHKPRALLQRFRDRSFRLQAVQGEHLIYFGDAQTLAAEIAELPGIPFRVFVEVLDPGTVRVEVL
jgi:peroxiredoxin